MESLAFGLTYAIGAGLCGIGLGLVGMGAMNPYPDDLGYGLCGRTSNHWFGCCTYH